MTIRRVRTVDGLGEPVGAFSQAVVANGVVYTSGQIPARADGTVPTDFEGQLETTLENLRTLLDGVGSGIDRVVKVNGYLTDAADLESYNRIYTRWFGDHLPARTTVCVSLWGVSLELECVALLREDSDD
ncbi:RidA family protein [Agromyces subbeticus]|uniref:RidA family protein n=1 Tax=Agromyces subbeticus TaxID=293890 RepID=UPI0003B386A6|nr:RidA family protein [Agromyces subbeticus]